MSEQRTITLHGDEYDIVLDALWHYWRLVGNAPDDYTPQSLDDIAYNDKATTLINLYRRLKDI